MGGNNSQTNINTFDINNLAFNVANELLKQPYNSSQGIPVNIQQ